MGGQTGHSLFKDQGQEFIMAYSPIELAGYQLFLYTPLETVLSSTDALKKTTLLMLGICFIVIIAIATFFGNSISQPIHRITKHVEQIAEGHLTADALMATSKDEIGTLTASINKMSVNLKELIHDVTNNAESLAAHAEELTASAEESKKTTEHITSSIQQISSGAETQSEQVSESARALEEMTAGIQQIAESSSEIAETSSATIDKAEVGGKSVEKTVEQMRSIQSSVEASNESIFLLDERSREIGKIVEIITGIANQTNLLALNAAIEAARAGEHGKGFAVVADEVRKLAEESKESSDQIKRLISEIQIDMAQSLEGMMKVTKDVSDGLVLADTTQLNFNEIIETTKSVTEQIDSMAATAEQLSAGAQQVTATFSVISDISRTASASTQEVASASEEQLGSMDEVALSAESLSHMALELREMVKKFQV
ncbi:methyl-accepting chemotaxis protein [Halalkalibacter alkalisediminis]|uniref:Methyl-accepting chemotaxis protein n=1 Tax=Halalkalibacter alkalisediminis TaxID=935616 RepID=A0ABV6NFL7_9BACI|nr:HAMP domain-containing methyl-accepting chemotaxis protein [Halalkalibacter alkalisediminis]